MIRRSIRIAFAIALTLFVVPASFAQETLALTLRSRQPAKENVYEPALAKANWKPSETVIIVCDMWDHHHCPTAEKRVGELAPRMNEVLNTARAKGVLILHAPSACMEAYKDYPGRKLARAAPTA